MAKKRRSRDFKNSSQVIDIEEARKKRHEKRSKNRTKAFAEQEQRRQKAGKGKNRKALVYLIIIVVMLSVAGASIYNILSLKQEQKALLEEQQRLKKQRQELQEELKHLEDPDYIEEQARTQLRLVMPGESIYVFSDEDAEKNKGTADKNDEENQ